MNGAATIREFKRVLLHANLNPTNAAPNLCLKGITTSAVCFAHVLGLVKFKVNRLGYVLAVQLAIGSNAPICTAVCFVSLY